LISVSLTPGPYCPAAKASPLARMTLADDSSVAMTRLIVNLPLSSNLNLGGPVS